MLDLRYVKLLVFDLDGVLKPTPPNEYPASILAGLTSMELEEKVAFTSTNWLYDLTRLGVDVSNSNTLRTISSRMIKCGDGVPKPYEWVQQVIPSLAKVKKLAILTNNSRNTVEQSLGHLKYHFSKIVTWENAPAMKPSPEGLLLICRELDIHPSQTLMIGDSEDDRLAAKSAEVRYFIANPGMHVSCFASC